MAEFDNGDRPPLWPEPDDSVVAAAREKYPAAALHKWRIGPEVLIVRSPLRGEYGRFRDGVWDTDRHARAIALEQMARDCVLYPDRPAFARMLERWPALAERIGNEILRLGRAQDDIEAEPL